MSVLTLCRQVGDFQSYTMVQDTAGGPTNKVWANNAFINVPCSIQPAGGSDVFKYAQRNMQVSHSIYFPYVMALTGQMRFVDNVGRVFLLQAWGDAAGHMLCFKVDCLLTNP